MENLKVEATKSTPAISFDATTGLLELTGKSYPENAAKFFSPVFEWMTAYLETQSPTKVHLNVKIIYLNSSSSKAFLNLFDMLDNYAGNGRSVVIDWHYHEEDETGLECGEEFQEDLESAVFNLVQITGD